MQPRDALVSSTKVKLLALGLAFLALASCWAMPLKMLFGEGGSYYTFAVIGDEMIYANRMQPLAVGATIQNPINGVCDPRVTSPYFLEDVVREVVTLSGLHIITFFWVWRFVFPIVFLASLSVLAWMVLPRRCRTWPCALIGASFFFAIHFAVYELAIDYPPMGGWILRIPTNVEYIIAALLAAAMIRFACTRRLAAGLIAVAMLLALIYLRPYAALPWSICSFAALLMMTARRELSIKNAAVLTGVLFAGLLPMLIVFHENGALPAFRQTTARYFEPEAYALHPRSAVFIAAGVLLGFATWRVSRRFRVLAGSAALTMLLLPFIAGAATSMRHEMLYFDRFSPFYLPLLGAVGVLALTRVALSSQIHRFRRPAMYATLLTAAFLAAQVTRYGAFNYKKYYCGCYGWLTVDQPNLAGYDWMRDHTPANALVLVDDRIHWGALGPDWRDWKFGIRAAWSEDLFQIVTRRRPVYHWRLYGSFMTHEQYAELVMLQRLTFGLEMSDEAAADRAYVKLLAWHHPAYLFWRAGRPGMRGRGERLRKIATVEYQDAACEVWKLNYPETVLAHPENVAPGDLLNP